ncbi:MAG: Crp/Fnr family transcriptional regulator [Tepidiformaceae bacterium]
MAEAPQSGNLLLSAIPPAEFELLLPLLESHPLRMRETLQEAGEPTEWVYFPVSGIISMLTVLENGMMIEFATVGREGTTGIPIIHGLDEANLALVSQLPGQSLRIRTGELTAAVRRFPALAEVLRTYGGVMFAFLAQSAACNRAHIVDERLARWLLMTHDQAGGDDFQITQEFLAQMLGVSRPSVALSAAVLHKAGLIRYHRGEMTITDRGGLEAAACECYGVIRSQFDRIRKLKHY